MSTDINAIALVVDRAGNPANLAVSFKNGDVLDACSLELNGCREACRPGANDDDFLHSYSLFNKRGVNRGLLNSLVLHASGRA